MVKLIVGRKGTGKTKMMVDAANQASHETVSYTHLRRLQQTKK